MTPVDFPGSNTILQPPAGMDNCDPLPAYRESEPAGPTVYASVWEMSDEEFEAIRKSRRVVIRIYSASHPPISVAAYE